MKKNVALMFLVMLTIASIGLSTNTVTAEPRVEQTWARMKGMITQWGPLAVHGGASILAREVSANGTNKQWVAAHAIWSQSPRQINCTNPPTENFTYSFYIAKLTNSTFLAFNYSGYALYASGYWDVYQETISYYVNGEGALVSFNLTIVPVVTDAEGSASVAGDLKTFEISIAGIEPLRGVVILYVVGHMEIIIGDMNGDRRLGIEDLVHVAKAYGAMPAFGNYDFDMDFNFDCQIDIGDIATIAANIKA